jgi:MFS family permease
LWSSTLAASLGAGMQQTATAWLALDAGAFAVGLVLAARMLPSLLFGLAAGTLADRAHRNRLLVGVSISAIPIMLVLNRLAASGSVAVWELVALAFATGCLSVFDVPARQALVMDTVPRDVAPNAMGLNALAGRLCTALGALAAGALIPTAGVAACYVAVALAFGVAAALVAFARPQASKPAYSSAPRPSFARAMSEAARLVVDVPAVRTLILAGIACEIFGFSFQTAVPVFARDVVAAGAEGLGTLNAATSLGGSLAVVTLSMLPSRVRREPVLGGVFVAYGASLVALAVTRDLPLAATFLLITGACAASFDLLQQTLIQLAVPEEQRGRAIGVWVLGIGSGPFGHVEMGSLVAALGAPTALWINGCLVLMAAATLLVRAPGYRWLFARGPVRVP